MNVLIFVGYSLFCGYSWTTLNFNLRQKNIFVIDWSVEFVIFHEIKSPLIEFDLNQWILVSTKINESTNGILFIFHNKNSDLIFYTYFMGTSFEPVATHGFIKCLIFVLWECKFKNVEMDLILTKMSKLLMTMVRWTIAINLFKVILLWIFFLTYMYNASKLFNHL